MPVAGKVDSGVERVIGLMVMNRPGQTGATVDHSTECGVGERGRHFSRSTAGDAADGNPPMRWADVFEQVTHGASGWRMQKIWGDFGAWRKHKPPGGHPWVWDGEVFVVNLEVVVEQQVEVDRAGAPADIPLPIERVFHRLEGAEEVTGRQVGFE